MSKKNKQQAPAPEVTYPEGDPRNVEREETLTEALAREKEEKLSEQAKVKAEKEAAKKAAEEARAAERAKKAELREQAKQQKEKEKEEARKAKEEAKQAAKLAKQEERERQKQEKLANTVIQNGIRRPSPDSKCGKAWAIFDSLSEKRGSPCAIGDALILANEQGLNPGNVKAEYAQWRKFYGITGRIPSASQIEQREQREANKEKAKELREAERARKKAERDEIRAAKKAEIAKEKAAKAAEKAAQAAAKAAETVKVDNQQGAPETVAYNRTPGRFA